MDRGKENMYSIWFGGWDYLIPKIFAWTGLKERLIVYSMDVRGM